MTAPGDIILVPRLGFAGFFIRLFQSFRYPSSYAKYTHCQIAVSSTQAVEARFEGVRLTAISSGTVVPCPVTPTPSSLTWLQSQAGDEYSVAVIIGLFFRLLFGFSTFFGASHHYTCSGLAAEFLAHCGEWIDDEPSLVTPAQLAQRLLDPTPAT